MGRAEASARGRMPFDSKPNPARALWRACGQGGGRRENAFFQPCTRPYWRPLCPGRSIALPGFRCRQPPSPQGPRRCGRSTVPPKYRSWVVSRTRSQLSTGANKSDRAGPVFFRGPRKDLISVSGPPAWPTINTSSADRSQAVQILNSPPSPSASWGFGQPTQCPKRSPRFVPSGRGDSFAIRSDRA